MSEWQPIATVPDKELVDIWVKNKDGSGVRWANCYYDHICDEYRTTNPNFTSSWVPARAVSHWMKIPDPPK